MRLIKVIFLLIFAFPANADIRSAEDLGNWMMYYYQNPDPKTVIPNIKKASELNLLKDTQKVGPPTFGFIAGILKNNPELASSFAEEMRSISDPEYGIILTGIWYANLPNNTSKIIVSEEISKRPNIKEKFAYLSDNPVSLLVLDPKRGAWVLDAMWGYFSATGDREPVVKIISVLPWIDESKKNEVMSMGKEGLYLMATSGAARWSLTANARQHKRVLEICKEEINKQKEPISSQLNDIVSKSVK